MSRQLALAKRENFFSDPLFQDIWSFEDDDLQKRLEAFKSKSSALGMISHKKSLITIFGLKHKIKNFIKKFDIFHEKISMAFEF